MPRAAAAGRRTLTEQHTRLQDSLSHSISFSVNVYLSVREFGCGGGGGGVDGDDDGSTARQSQQQRKQHTNNQPPARLYSVALSTSAAVAAVVVVDVAIAVCDFPNVRSRGGTIVPHTGRQAGSRQRLS